MENRQQLNRLTKELDTSAKKLKNLSRSMLVPYTLNASEVELIVRVFKSVKFKSFTDLDVARTILIKLGEIYEERKN